MDHHGPSLTFKKYLLLDHSASLCYLFCQLVSVEDRGWDFSRLWDVEIAVAELVGK